MNGKLAIASLTDVIFMGTYQLVMQHCSPSPIIDYSLIVTGNNISTLIVIRAHHLCTAYCRSKINQSTHQYPGRVCQSIELAGMFVRCGILR
jgi:hypothetical protein